MQYTSVFRHPTKGVYRHSFGQKTVRRERSYAQSMSQSSSDVFGEFLFSRRIAQELMETGKRYAIRINSAAQFFYRLDEHELGGQFDYCQINLDGVLRLVVNHPVEIPELKLSRNVQVELSFNAANSFQFRDLCKENLVAVVFEDGKALMQFYPHSFSPPIGQIELTVTR